MPDLLLRELSATCFWNSMNLLCSSSTRACFAWHFSFISSIWSLYACRSSVSWPRRSSSWAEVSKRKLRISYTLTNVKDIHEQDKVLELCNEKLDLKQNRFRNLSTWLIYGLDLFASPLSMAKAPVYLKTSCAHLQHD